jgi:beta-glucosidase
MLTLFVANATGSGWDAAFAQASAFVSNLTLEEKAGLVTGDPFGPCVGKHLLRWANC